MRSWNPGSSINGFHLPSKSFRVLWNFLIRPLENFCHLAFLHFPFTFPLSAFHVLFSKAPICEREGLILLSCRPTICRRTKVCWLIGVLWTPSRHIPLPEIHYSGLFQLELMSRFIRNRNWIFSLLLNVQRFLSLTLFFLGG